MSVVVVKQRWGDVWGFFFFFFPAHCTFYMVAVGTLRLALNSMYVQRNISVDLFRPSVHRIQENVYLEC